MHVFLLMAMLWAAPFWEAKPARSWTDEELMEMFTNSPWAQTTTFRDASGVAVYLATAKPLREAEDEAMRRYLSSQAKQDQNQEARTEYEAFLQENPGKVVVLAIREPNLMALAEAAETRQMEEESRLKAGGKSYKITGYFPPVPSDPALRLVFPRPTGNLKELNFELYIPGATGPYRNAVFRMKDLAYRGQTEF